MCSCYAHRVVYLSISKDRTVAQGIQTEQLGCRMAMPAACREWK